MNPNLDIWFILLLMCIKVVNGEVEQGVSATGWRLHHNLGLHFIEWCGKLIKFWTQKVPSHYVPPCNKSSSKSTDWIHIVFPSILECLDLFFLKKQKQTKKPFLATYEEISGGSILWYGWVAAIYLYIY